MRLGRWMDLPLLAVAGAILLTPTAASAQKKPTQVYVVCTVRDVADTGDGYVGTIYRSDVFFAPADYDTDISLKPERPSRVSEAFEKWVWETYGLRPDRSALSSGSEHYCVEAPKGDDGHIAIWTLATAWDSARFPGMKLVRTGWEPSDQLLSAPARATAEEQQSEGDRAWLAEAAAKVEAARLQGIAEREAKAAEVARIEAANRQAQEDYRRTVAAQNAAHEAALAQHRAEVERVQQGNAQRRREWEAKVAACKAGDYSQCATQ